MKFYKYCTLLFVILIVNSCNNTLEKEEKQETNADVGSISKRIQDSVGFQAIVQTRRKIVFIDVVVPVYEVYFESRLEVLRQRSIISSIDLLQSADSVLINFDYKEAKGEKRLVCFTRSNLVSLNDLWSKNKMYKDYSNYISKNINGLKLEKFMIYLEVLQKVDLNVVKTTDYITMLYKLIHENQGKLKNAYIRETLVALRKMLIDSKDWKEFNPEDIDYFLNYKF